MEERGGRKEIPEFEQATKVKYSEFLRIGEEHEREILRNLKNNFRV